MGLWFRGEIKGKEISFSSKFCIEIRLGTDLGVRVITIFGLLRMGEWVKNGVCYLFFNNNEDERIIKEKINEDERWIGVWGFI